VLRLAHPCNLLHALSWKCNLGATHVAAGSAERGRRKSGYPLLLMPFWLG